MFFFFSNRLGCLGSLLLSLAATAVLVMALHRWVPGRLRLALLHLLLWSAATRTAAVRIDEGGDARVA